MSYDLISIGDPTIDTFLKIHDAHVACKLNREECQICINYADKIPVDQFFRFPAGNMPNNAVGATRLGLKTAIYGVIGADDDGDWIRRELNKEGVETKYLRVDDHHSTNSSTVIVFQGERTIFVWHQERQYHLPVLPSTEWVYLTSAGPLGENLGKLHRQVLGYLKSHSAKLAFNPGTYQMMLGRDGLMLFLERSELLFLNKEEAQELSGKRTADVRVLLRTLYELGPKVVVITNGSQGSYSFDGHTYRACGIYDLAVVERTGAGDAYSSAFLSAYHYGLGIPEAMRWGTFNAAYVLGQFGGILGLLELKQMKRLAADEPQLKVREL